jgi:hypothetical protein
MIFYNVKTAIVYQQDAGQLVNDNKPVQHYKVNNANEIPAYRNTLWLFGISEYHHKMTLR